MTTTPAPLLYRPLDPRDEAITPARLDSFLERDMEGAEERLHWHWYNYAYGRMNADGLNKASTIQVYLLERINELIEETGLQKQFGVCKYMFKYYTEELWQTDPRYFYEEYKSTLAVICCIEKELKWKFLNLYYFVYLFHQVNKWVLELSEYQAKHRQEDRWIQAEKQARQLHDGFIYMCKRSGMDEAMYEGYEFINEYLKDVLDTKSIPEFVL